jgi:hypothetical protein
VIIQTDRRIVTSEIQLNSVSPGFFSTLNIRILSGRGFDAHDSRPAGETGRRSAIVNEAFVRRYLAGVNPLGVRIAEDLGANVRPDIVIVGVCADFSYRGIREESEQAFFPIFESDDAGATFYVRVRGTPEQAFQSIRAVLRRADPGLPMLFAGTFDQQISRSLITERMLAALSSSLGALALLLSLIGLYGVMSFVVTRRTREIGIRLALGATGASAVGLVLRDAAAMIAAGMAIALPCIGALGKLVQSQLFGVTATDPATVASAMLLLGAASIAAALVPAWRAARLQPTDALRLD